MFREGEEGGKARGAICEVRLEVGCEVRHGDEPRGRGDDGTLLRSGAIFEC